MYLNGTDLNPILANFPGTASVPGDDIAIDYLRSPLTRTKEPPWPATCTAQRPPTSPSPVAPRVISGAVLTLWTAAWRHRITDLLDVDSGGLHHGHVRGRQVGRLLQAGLRQDRALGRLRSKGRGWRYGPTDITGDPPVMSIGTVGTGTAAASLTGTSEAPVLNLTLPAPAPTAWTPPRSGLRRHVAKIADNHHRRQDRLQRVTPATFTRGPPTPPASRRSARVGRRPHPDHGDP